jgi:hypothetical protein
MVGYEQPLSKKISFVSDWFAATTASGMRQASALHCRRTVFSIGYSIGQGRSNALFIFRHHA